MLYKREETWHLDVTISGVHYRESLKTSDKREAKNLQNERIAAIKAGKGASKAGRAFARLPFAQAAAEYIETRKPHVSARTHQLDRERMKPLLRFFDSSLLRVRAVDIAAYQSKRQNDGVSGRTINMEITVLRGMLKKAKVWNALAEDVTMLPEGQAPIAQVLTAEQKSKLFETAASNEDWTVAYYAAVLAVSTTCRGVELKNLRWQDVYLEKREVWVTRSKTQGGLRKLPLNADAMTALARLWERAEIIGSTQPEHYVFPACEKRNIDPTKPQKSWRSAWRKLTEKAGMKGFRFHDLRHQAITEMAETNVSDATLMSIAGHLSRRMLEHYSHIRMAAKREAVDSLSSGLIQPIARKPEQTQVQ
jgi:integrase